MVPLKLSPKIESFYGFCSQAKNGVGGGGLYGFLRLLQGSHWDNSPLKTIKLGRVAFH